MREPRIGLDLLGNLDAELALEVDVDDGEVGARAADELERGLAALEELDVEAEARQVLAQERAEGAGLIGDGRDAATRRGVEVRRPRLTPTGEGACPPRPTPRRAGS